MARHTPPVRNHNHHKLSIQRTLPLYMSTCVLDARSRAFLLAFPQRRLYGVSELWIIPVRQIIFKGVFEPFFGGCVSTFILEDAYIAVHDGQNCGEYRGDQHNDEAWRIHRRVFWLEQKRTNEVAQAVAYEDT
jgi:hypothetical protein